MILSNNESKLCKLQDHLPTVISDIGKPDMSIPTGIASLDDKMNGLYPSDLIVIGGRPSMGKEQPLTSNILSPRGWISMGQVKEKDVIFSADGSLTEITGVYYQGIKDIYKVTLSNGDSTECGLNHLWCVQTRNNRKKDYIKSLKEIQKNLKRDFGKRNNYSIKKCSPLQFPKKKLALDPYLMGFYLGDGWTNGTSVMLYLHNSKIEQIRSLLPGSDVLCGTTQPNHYRVKKKIRDKKPTMFYEFLYNLQGKRSWEKYIPEEYLFGNIEQRKRLLQGLLDTDGYKINNNWHEYSTTSKVLANQVKFLVKSLGGHCNYIERLGRYKKDGQCFSCRKNYRVFLSFITRPNYIDKIEYMGQKECKCITISHPSGLYITDDFIVTHNSSLLTDIALHISRNRHVLIFSLEMTAYNLTQRMLCNLAGVSLFKLRKNTLTERELRNINDTYKVLYKPNSYNISIDETTRITPDDMEETISMLNNLGDKVDCVLIDYMQLMGLRSSHENRNQELSVISRQLKGIANKFGIPVVVLSQLNRGVEYRENRRPLMSDLRDCGSIEQDADVVLLLYREGYYTRVNNPDAIDNGTAEMILTKVRNGATGIAVATWDAEGMTFNPRLRLSLGEF